MKCNLCDKDIYCPYHVTEKNSKGKWETHDLCIPCALAYLSAFEPLVTSGPKSKSEIDLTEIKTTEELLTFITAHQQAKKDPCPTCKLTLKEFDEKGRFGCPQCYEHFTEIIEELVFPYHGKKDHVGKVPKRKTEDMGEQLKLLRLKMVRAIEFEQFEEAAKIKKQLDDLSSPS
jgi:protein arginine kinase activator